MSNNLVRFGKIHLLAWVLGVPMFALAVRQTEDALSFAGCGTAALAYGYAALALRPRAFFVWLAERSIFPKLARLVFIAVALTYMSVAVSFPFVAGVGWPMLVTLIAAALCWLFATFVSLFAEPSISESL